MRFLLNAISFKKKIQKDLVTTYSAYTTLYIILSFLPFIMFLLTLLQFTSLTADDLIRAFRDVIPSQFYELLEGVIRELYSQANGTVLSLSLILALWSASKGAYGLLRGLNSVYHVNENRNYIITRLMAMFYTLVFGISLVLTLVLMVFGNHIQIFIAAHWPVLGRITGIILSLRTLIVIVMLMLFFLLIYRVLPIQKGKLRRQLPGAVLAAVGWSLFSFFFSLYVDRYPGISVTYGFLTTITLLLFWMYICINIVLIGGAFNKWLEDHHT